MELASLTPENLGKAASITLRPEQEAFVAPVVQLIAEAYVNPTAWPRLVVDGDEVLAFIMGNFDPDHEIEAFRAGIWRLNVAASAGSRGGTVCRPWLGGGGAGPRRKAHLCAVGTRRT